MLDLVGSTILAAAVILAIIGLNFLLSDASQQFQTDLTVQENMVEFTRAIEWDFAKIGYRDTTKAPVLKAKKDTISFLADIHNTGVINRVTYFRGPAETRTPNPNDFVLYRVISKPSGNDTLKLNMGLTRFEMTYFDSTGAVTTVPQNVKGFKVEARLEAPRADKDTVFAGVYWEKRFQPRNLNLPR
jgi:hypothetical protein